MEARERERAKPRLAKRLGQHHLREPALCRPLVTFLRPEGARVVEIGPGGGVLTRALLDAGARVLALELDLAWAAFLRAALAAEIYARRLDLAAADALDVPWPRLPFPTLVAGNLPYNVATAIVARVLPHHGRVPRAAFLVQKEVAERLVAGVGDPGYGALSVLVAARARARILGIVKPGSFHPPPKVTSAFVGLELRSPPIPEAAMPSFERLVRAAFAQRRKTLKNALGAAYGGHEAAAMLARAAIDGRLRAEALGLEEFLRLAAPH